MNGLADFSTEFMLPGQVKSRRYFFVFIFQGQCHQEGGSNGFDIIVRTPFLEIFDVITNLVGNTQRLAEVLSDPACFTIGTCAYGTESKGNFKSRRGFPAKYFQYFPGRK